MNDKELDKKLRGFSYKPNVKKKPRKDVSSKEVLKNVRKEMRKMFG